MTELMQNQQSSVVFPQFALNTLPASDLRCFRHRHLPSIPAARLPAPRPRHGETIRRVLKSASSRRIVPARLSRFVIPDSWPAYRGRMRGIVAHSDGMPQRVEAAVAFHAGGDGRTSDILRACNKVVLSVPITVGAANMTLTLLTDRLRLARTASRRRLTRSLDADWAITAIHTRRKGAEAGPLFLPG